MKPEREITGGMMYYRGILMVAALLGGCKDSTQQRVAQVEVVPQIRAVATVYRVTAQASCYQAADSHSPLVTVLQAGQLVDLVSVKEGTLQQGQEYWLHVYPRPGKHLFACHINVLNLVPVS
jgi:hypothetical protein